MKNQDARHSYRAAHDSGAVEFHWFKNKRPTREELEELVSQLREHPDFDEAALDEVDLENADQREFERVRNAQEQKKKPRVGAILGITRRKVRP